MSQFVHAFIEHRLTPYEVLALPALLRVSTEPALAGQWTWTIPDINVQTLSDRWALDVDHFIGRSWSDKDLPLLVKDDLTLHFYSPQLVLLSSSLRWSVYLDKEELRKEFNSIASALLYMVKAVDLLFVPDLSGVPFFDESTDLSISVYRQKAAGNRLYAVELTHEPGKQ